MPELALGTVQFGLDYGLSNPTGVTPPAEVERILEIARTIGIKTLDTAAAYGASEELLGRLCSEDRDFQIVTKTPAFRAVTVGSVERRQLTGTFHRSLARLRRKRIYGLLAHHADDLLVPGGEGLWEAMERLKAAGHVDRIGASVYSPAQVAALLDRYSPDIVQLPCNLLDNRFEESGYLNKLSQRGVDIHARSVFLQGLLLMDPVTTPAYFAPIRAHLTSLRQFLSRQGLSPLASALQYVRQQAHLTTIVIGINNHDQLEEVAAAWDLVLPEVDLRRWALNDERWVNPSRWELS